MSKLDAMEPSRKKQKVLQLGLLSLPDDVIVEIFQLLGAREYLVILKVSKMLNRSFKNEELVSKMVGFWNTEIHRYRESSLLPSHSNAPVKISSAEQLIFYESAWRHYLLEENRCRFYHWYERSYSYFNLITRVRMILQECPSASVVLEAHCCISVQDDRTQIANSKYRGRLIFQNIMYGFYQDLMSIEEEERKKKEEGLFWDWGRRRRQRQRYMDGMFIRTWGNRAMNAASLSNHPFKIEAKNGAGWVEIFLRVDNNGRTLELPPRPDYYRGLDAPELQRYEEVYAEDNMQHSKYGEIMDYMEENELEWDEAVEDLGEDESVEDFDDYEDSDEGLW